MIYNDIPSKEELKNYDKAALSALCDGLRENIIYSVAKNGGHLASNLGVVELTVALHRVFDFPEDKVIFDVGHQSYVHKMLSGRIDGFENLRSCGGVSGFQLREESEYDFFGGGHSGTSVSAALAFAESEKLCGGKRYAIAVVGDGSFTNGMIFEAINNAAKENLKLIIIINDNEMSISENVGALSRYFRRLRTSVRYYRLKRRVKRGLGKMRLFGRIVAAVSKAIKNFVKRLVYKTNFFEYLGMDYMGPVDGHDTLKLEAILKEAKLTDKPVIIHVCTKKGKGYEFAEKEPEKYHSVPAFDKDTGITIISKETFSEHFGKTLSGIAGKDEKIVAITAAMCEGTGLSEFKEKHKERFFDTGISEEHSVTFAAGLAASGLKPVFAVYSSFLQRGYDQIIHDVCTQNLPVVFAIDRAGFVSGDGKTHQGIFDLSFLLQIPGIEIYTPENYDDLDKALKEAIESEKPCAIRYPKGCETEYDRSSFNDRGDFSEYVSGTGEKTVTVITYGRTAKNAFEAAKLLENELRVRVVVLKKIKNTDIARLYQTISDSSYVLFVEEQIKTGGVGEYLISAFASSGMKLDSVGLIAPDDFPPQRTLSELYEKYGMTPENIAFNVKNNV